MANHHDSHHSLVVQTVDEMIKSGKYLALFTLIKAFRQGLVYGVKVRAPHALVLNLVWGSGPLRAIPKKVFAVTKTHALGLAYSSVIFVVVTRLLQMMTFNVRTESGSLVVARAPPSLRWWHSAAGGFLIGFLAWGDASSGVHQQMMMYIVSRLVVALYQIASERVGFEGSAMQYRVYSGCLWALLMTLLTVEPESLQASMRKSLEYVFLENKYFSSFQSLFLRHSRR